MSIPTVEGNWYSRGNVPYPDSVTQQMQAKSWFWLLKAFLKGEVNTGTTASNISGSIGNVTRPTGSYWTYEGSSDGAGNYNMSPTGSDLWTSSFDPTKLVGAADTINHSWIALKSPAALGPIYMCINWPVEETWSGGSPFHAGLFFSYHPFANGTATSRPYATGGTNLEWMPTNAGATAMDGAVTVFELIDGYQNYSAHFTVNEKGGFHFATSHDTTSCFFSYLFCEKAVDTYGGDNCPVWAGFHGTPASGRGAPEWAFMRSYTQGRYYADTGIATGASSMLLGNYGIYAAYMPKDAVSLKFNALPIYIIDAGGWRGRLPDMWVTGNPLLTAGWPADSAPSHHVVGDILAPFVVTPKL